MRDIESIKKEVKDAVNGNKANIAKRGWKSFINAVEFANRSAEDFSRFVTFMTSRQQGKNIVDAIYDAKDITVNFNKKGSGEMGSRFMNFAYIFFNAAVQSINNFGTMLKQHPARTMLVISKFGALGFECQCSTLSLQHFVVVAMMISIGTIWIGFAETTSCYVYHS